MKDLIHNYSLLVGDSQTYQVSDQDTINVIREDWEDRGGLLRTTVLAIFRDTPNGKRLADGYLAKAKRTQE